MCLCFWIIAVLSEGVQTSFMFALYFYSLPDPVILFVVCTFIFKGKLASKIFRKVLRNELNTQLTSGL
jgi:hypothetical protein